MKKQRDGVCTLITDESDESAHHVPEPHGSVTRHIFAIYGSDGQHKSQQQRLCPHVHPREERFLAEQDAQITAQRMDNSVGHVEQSGMPPSYSAAAVLWRRARHKPAATNTGPR
jgi:hypothetical protein